MSFSITITRKAQKALAKIPFDYREKIIASIRELADELYPPGAKKLSGRDAWRIRIGMYRVIYEVHQQVLSIVVVLVGHRKDIYRK